jgi:hypothetical protein
MTGAEPNTSPMPSPPKRPVDPLNNYLRGYHNKGVYVMRLDVDKASASREQTQ